MAQEFRKVNGQWVVIGSQRSSDQVPFVKPAEKPAGPRPVGAKAKRKGKAVRWAGDGLGWQSEASYNRLRSSGRLNPSIWHRLRNEAKWVLKSVGQMNAGTVPTGTVPLALGAPGSMLPATQYRTSSGGVTYTSPAERQVAAAATVGVIDNAARMGYSQWQRHVEKKPTADPTAGGFGSGLQAVVETGYRALGATPPSQMDEFQVGFDATARSLSLNAALTALPFGMLTKGATTLAGTAVRGGLAFALGEVASNYLDDNTGGSIINAINAVAGTNLPGGVDVGNDDMVDAANKSLIPNAVASVVPGAALGLGVGIARGATGGFRNIGRRLRGARQIELTQRARSRQEAAGLLEPDEDGGFRFTEEAQQPAPAPAPAAGATPAASPMDEFKAANAAMEERLGMTPEPQPAAAAPTPEPAAPRKIPTIEDATTENFGKAQPGELPQDDLAGDLWDPDPIYDPSLPESDGLLRAVEELDDAELAAIAQGNVPVVESVNQALETRPPVEIDPNARLDMAAAPRGNLAQPIVPFSEQWEALPANQLRSLASPENSPELFNRIQGITGADWEQFSKADILDGLSSLQEDGITVLPNRLIPDQQVMGTGEIAADPTRFQYKGNVDADGVQLEGSLSDVDGWNTDAEGALQVWQDPADGRTYVVNGHNRLALAQRLGIPSVRVEPLLATTAEQARAQGAIANISSGGGTVFDAAKFLRDSGVSDPATLRRMGIPLDSGFGAQGLALSRLPEDVFQATVNGQVPTRRAVIIGESGADEETMRSAYRYLVQQGPDTVKEDTLREMLAMARSAPTQSSGEAPQASLFAGTEWEQSFNEGMLAKANLAAAVRQLLGKEKKLFGTVGRQAGQIGRVGQVDAAAAKEISGEAGRALTIFDELKYQSGPVSDLLNEGTERILRGEQPAAVAQGIKNRLAAAISEAMGKEVGQVSDVVQESMFSMPTQAADGQLPPDAQEVIGELEAFAASLGESASRNAEMARRGLESAAGIEDVDGAPALDRIVPSPRLTAAEREQMQLQVLQRAIANGEVRPPSTPIPQLPDEPKVRPSDLNEGNVNQAMADELRLAVEHARSDAADAWDQETSLRDAFGYEERTFEEKKDLGMLDGFDEVTPAEVMPLDSAAGLAPPPVRPEPLRLTSAVEQPELQLPFDLRKASPRYGKATIEFESDLDRAAYILANDAVKPSKAAGKFRQVVKEAGLDVADVVAHGKKVKAAIKQAAKGGPNQIALPAQPWDRGLVDEMAVEGWDSIDTASFDTQKTRLERQITALKIIRQVAGPEAEVRFEDQYLKKIRGAEWGGDGKATSLHGGYYRLREDLIMVRGVLQGSETNVAEAAFHESFHRLQYLALGEKEAKVLDSLWSRVKVAIGANHVTGSPSTGKPIAYSESQAVAFQRYAEAKRNGQDPVVAMLGGYDPDTPIIQKAVIQAVALFDRIAEFVEKLFNRFALGTFDSTRSIFERARRGALVEQADSAFEEAGSGFERMMAQDGWRSTSWDLQKISRGGGDSAIRQQIEANNRAILDGRRKAQQEGC